MLQTQMNNPLTQIPHPPMKEKLIPFPKYRCFLQSKYLSRKCVSLYKKNRPKYRKLEYIEHNDSLNLLAGTCLKKALQVIKSHHPLIALDLQFTKCPHITDQCFFIISHYIRKIPLLHSLTLNFSRCDRISDGTLELLKNSFQKLVHLQSLSLDFSDCTGITNKGLKNLSQGIKGLVSLKNLSLEFSEYAKKVILQKLYDKNSCVELEDQGFCYLSESLKSLRRLENLKLIAQRLTSLSGELFGYFCRDFGRLKSLTYADIDFSGASSLTEDSLADLSFGISKITTLKELNINIGWNETGDEGLWNVVKGLKNLKSLKSLSIDCTSCYVTEEGVKAIGEELKEFEQLEELYLTFVWCYQVKKEFLKKFEDEVKRMRNWKKVGIAGNQ